jgi:hypothetical protein
MEELVRLVEEETVIGCDLQAFLGKVLSDGLSGPPGGWTEHERKKYLHGHLVDELHRLFSEKVGLKAGFMEKHFSFPAVLRKNLPHWNHAIEEASRSPDSCRLDNLKEKLRATLGVDPGMLELVPNGNPPLPPLEELLAGIAASLVATCVPWWSVGNSTWKKSLVFLPYEPGRNDEMRVKRACERMGGGGLKSFGLFGPGLGGTPFAYLAYAEEEVDARGRNREETVLPHPLDRVHSLDGWRKPEVKKWLRLAEREDGASLFAAGPGNPGLGYVSPLFVRDKALSYYRWKPWADGGDGA